MKNSISNVLEVLEQLKNDPQRYNLDAADLEKVDKAIEEAHQLSNQSNAGASLDFLLKVAKFLEIVKDLFFDSDALPPP